MGLLIDVAVAKTNKDASRDSGDTVEIVERPAGGIAIVLADGQGSGRSAKTLSQMVTARAATSVPAATSTPMTSMVDETCPCR